MITKLIYKYAIPISSVWAIVFGLCYYFFNTPFDMILGIGLLCIAYVKVRYPSVHKMVKDSQREESK